MSSDSTALKIEKLTIENYATWKIRVGHVLAIKDLEETLNEDPPKNAKDLLVWNKKDRKARAIIGLALSDDLLENVREVE